MIKYNTAWPFKVCNSLKSRPAVLRPQCESHYAVLHFKLDPYPVITFMTKTFSWIHQEKEHRWVRERERNGGFYRPLWDWQQRGHREVMQTEQNTEKLKAWAQESGTQSTTGTTAEKICEERPAGNPMHHLTSSSSTSRNIKCLTRQNDWTQRVGVNGGAGGRNPFTAS